MKWLKKVFSFKKTIAKPESARLDNVGVLLGILDNLPTSIFVKDEQLRFVYSNAGHCDLIGKPESALLGFSDADFYSADIASGFMARDRAVLKTGAASVTEEMATRRDGKTRPVVTRKAKHVAPDGKTYLIGTNTDLTEIKRREEQYRLLAETVPVGVMRVDESGAINFTNQLCLSHLGLSHSPASFAEVADLFAVSPPGFPGLAQNFESGIKYLQEALRLDPNNVILSGQLNTIAIRLDEIHRQNEIHESMPKGRTILVVDDSATVRKLISGKLEKSGHTVVCAEDGVEGLARIAEKLPDLVLLDITMPRMDGYEVCKQIRANPASKDVPVVMISGKDGFFDKVRGRMAGTTGYVTKPFGPETLMKALETYLLQEDVPVE